MSLTIDKIRTQVTNEDAEKDLMKLDRISTAIEMQLSNEDYIRIEPLILEIEEEYEKLGFRNGFIAAISLWRDIEQ